MNRADRSLFTKKSGRPDAPVRSRKNEKAQSYVGHDELGARRRSGMTTGGGNSNAPLPRLEGLSNGGGDCSAEEGEAVGTLD